jgi:hypothetical protein
MIIVISYFRLDFYPVSQVCRWFGGKHFQKNVEKCRWQNQNLVNRCNFSKHSMMLRIGHTNSNSSLVKEMPKRAIW